MVESENRQLSAGVQCRDAIVFAAGGCSDEVQQRVARLLERLQARALFNRIEFCDVTRADAMDSIPASANLFVFLIDDEHLNSACASRAAYLATRKSVTGKALVVSLLTQADTEFKKSPLSFMAPLDAYGSHLEHALQTLEQNITEFLKADAGSNSAETRSVKASQPTPLSTVTDMFEVDARLDGASQIAETVEPLPCHMSAYDDFIEHLIGRLQVMRMHDRRRNLNLFSEAVRKVLGAEMVYCYYRGKNGALHLYEAESNQPVHECSASVVHSV